MGPEELSAVCSVAVMGRVRAPLCPRAAPAVFGVIVMSGPFWKSLGLVLQVLLLRRENTGLEEQQ